jgi:hypothetical protein
VFFGQPNSLGYPEARSRGLSPLQPAEGAWLDCLFQTSDVGWESLTDGELLGRAEANGFELLITAGKQRNLIERTIFLIVMSTTDWPTVRTQLDLIVEAVNASSPGTYSEVALERPPLRRRPFNPSEEC